MTMINQYTDPTTLVVQSTINRTPATGTEAMYHLIQLMVASGKWVHWASCDGTLFSTPANGTNTASTPMRITNYTTGTTVGSLANANSYVVLKHVDSGRLMGFQGATVNAHTTWRIKYVPQTAAFATQLVFAAGTAALMPYFGDANDIGSAYLYGSSKTLYSAMFAGNGTYRFNARCDDTDMMLWAGCWTSGTGVTSAHMAFMIDKMVPGTFPGVSEDPDDDNDPYIFYLGSTSYVGYSATGATSLCLELAGPCPLMTYLRKDLSGEGWVSISALVLCTNNGAFQQTVPSKLGSNPHNRKEDQIPVFFGRRGAVGSPPVGYKGVSTLLRWNSATRATGEPLTKVVPRDRICIGDINLPWDGSVPVI